MEPQKNKSPKAEPSGFAESTGLEPAASGLTGQRSNRLNYDSPVGTEADTISGSGSGQLRNSVLNAKSPGAAFFLALRGDRGFGPDPFAAHARAIHTINTSLWALEEQVRDRSLSNHAVARLKRGIDHTNLARHRAIAALDLRVDAVYRPKRRINDPGVVLNSESIGQMVDRLSILALKLDAHEAHKRRNIEERRLLLVRCVDLIIEALREGQALAQSFDEAKTYSA